MLSSSWVEAVSAILHEAAVGQDLMGIEYTFCEEYTGVPEDLQQPGSVTAGWSYLIQDGRLRVSGDLVENPTLKVIADYDVILPLARLKMSDPQERDTLDRLAQEAAASGALRTMGDRANQPAFFDSEALHDAIADITA